MEHFTFFLLDQPSIDAFKSAVNLPHWFYTSAYFIIYLLSFLLLFFLHIHSDG